MSSHTERDLADYFLDAIEHDYLVNVLITSHTQGKLKSRNMPFGLGKTTLEFWLNYLLNGKDWNKTFETTKYNGYDFLMLFDPALRDKEGRLNAVSFDDVQATMPAEQGVPRAVRKMANYLTTSRPEVACILGSADNINNISAPLRKIFLFEIIVAERGEYEVQKITYHKNYKKPLHDLGRLEYLQEGTFPKLPTDIEDRYRRWRVAEKTKLFPSLKTEMSIYSKLHECNPEDLDKENGLVTLNAHVVKLRRGQCGVLFPLGLSEKLYDKEVTLAISKNTQT